MGQGSPPPAAEHPLELLSDEWSLVLKVQRVFAGCLRGKKKLGPSSIFPLWLKGCSDLPFPPWFAPGEGTSVLQPCSAQVMEQAGNSILFG